MRYLKRCHRFLTKRRRNSHRPHDPLLGQSFIKHPDRAGLAHVVKQLVAFQRGDESMAAGKGSATTEKTLGNTDINGTRKNVPDVMVYGDGDTFALWLKASSQNEGWMKSSKVANVPGGCLVQTETQQRNFDKSYALSQALAFVPGVWLDKTQDPPCMVPCDSVVTVVAPFHADLFGPFDPDGEESDHEHQKVYSPMILPTLPAQRPWICSICGKEGVDHDILSETYDEMRKRFGKEPS